MTPQELYIYRCHARLSQADMAARLKVSRATINRWERGLRPMPDDIVQMLANSEVGALHSRTAAEQRAHDQTVADDIAWYRDWRRICDHASTMARRRPPALLDDAVAILAADYPDFTQTKGS